MSFNKIIICGYVGRDPELRYTPSGKAVADFSIATTHKTGDTEATTWFKVTFWESRAEIASQYLTKGKQVYVEGRLSQREYTDRDGNKKVSLEVHGTELQFIGGGKSEDSSATAPRASMKAQAPTSRQPDDQDDQIPF